MKVICRRAAGWGAWLCWSCCAAAAAGVIPWRSGPLEIQPRGREQIARDLSLLSSRPLDRHMVVVFDRPLAPEERGAIQAGGLRLLSYLGSNAFFGAVDASGVDAEALAGRYPLSAVLAIETGWKVHPFLLEGGQADWARVGSTPDGDAIIGVYVLFHEDVSLEDEALDVVRRYGGVLRDFIDPLKGLVVEMPQSRALALAGEDPVQWVEPALPQLSEVNDGNRARVGADAAQQAPYNLAGRGVNVLVYDAGRARATHLDFGGRLFTRDDSVLSAHATHVAGTVGGSGAASGGLRRGMAPAVTLQSYGFQYDGQPYFLYNNPGDISADYAEAINRYGVHIATNSIGTNTASNGFPCSFQGDYSVTDKLIDEIVRGSLSGGVPFRVIWAAGNERQTTRCDIEGHGRYYSTAPPACAKNHITVGALNSNDDSMTGFSSWGPVDDGRMKPDLSAPGCQSDGDFGVTSCTSASDTSYAAFCGTSMACPTVCGICCLLLEDWREQFPGRPDPRNSTLKTLLAHQAVDLGNPGPDNQFGYGSVRILPTIDFLRSGHFREAAVDQDQTVHYRVVVRPGTAQLKVTLAWDDVSGTVNTIPSLVNDLDLLVFSPAGAQAFPWTLDPDDPGAPAARTQRNGRDNIEQVLVDDPLPGDWRVEVAGVSVPVGPQPFSICASPELADGACPGDLNADGRVDQADLGILLSCYHVGACGDLDGDGDTDQADLGILLARYGAACP